MIGEVKALIHSTMQDTCTMMQPVNRSTSRGTMIGARDLQIEGMGNSCSWKYTYLLRDRVEVAELKQVRSLSIVGKINVESLIKNTSYGAFLVFKFNSKPMGLEKAKALVRFLKDQVKGVDYDGLSMPVFIAKKRSSPNEFGQFARDRGDRWMEVQLGEFYNEGGDDGEVQIQLKSTTPETKSGLFVRGIEVRPIDKE